MQDTRFAVAALVCVGSAVRLVRAERQPCCLTQPEAAVLRMSLDQIEAEVADWWQIPQSLDESPHVSLGAPRCALSDDPVGWVVRSALPRVEP